MCYAICDVSLNICRALKICSVLRCTDTLANVLDQSRVLPHVDIVYPCVTLTSNILLRCDIGYLHKTIVYYYLNNDNDVALSCKYV